MAHTLIVEKDADSARMMASIAADQGCSAATAPSLSDARRQLALQQPDLVLLDLHLPDGSGFALLDEQELIGPSDVVLMTGQPSIETAMQALRRGACDCLAKPISPQQLQLLLARYAFGREGLLQPVAQPATASERFGLLVGASEPMRRVYEQIARVAGTSVTVFITGESGTGKELAARTVHDRSRRRDKPFLAVNCGAISPQLMESEIFGHEKGSFTGADRQHQGFFERADGGTLFLDEITEMPQALQVKLLRVLESGSFMRVGSTEARQTDVRVIAASNRKLDEAVRAGALREDLLYRLNVFPIEMPPLRQRMADLPLLSRHLLAQMAEREGAGKRLGASALAVLAQQPWPGNVRELRNVLQRAWVMSPGAEIDEQWLPPARGITPAAAAGAGLSVAVGSSLAEVERQVILATLAHFGHHKERTAAALGVSLKTLHNRLKDYGAA
ncbi:sigma-54-dependent transcriptional regulator [Ramlibacter rhizophilus]|uniref:Sigma-54-dependent Fis family transcriptional regulator n=1 Tax=Ramlibacter rhizophilus TaxID=1781167 RepID=A0A4Z0BSV6_9BURK|nr:sigma-54 dependent transcriptional regulator [Ramlibacter rhizophilus]TFZ01338.1 sigma-54-dependent Fis family transcriptional regulator [Ramlibacter rhizophilus]